MICGLYAPAGCIATVAKKCEMCGQLLKFRAEARKIPRLWVTAVRTWRIAGRLVVSDRQLLTAVALDYLDATAEANEPDTNDQQFGQAVQFHQPRNISFMAASVGEHQAAASCFCYKRRRQFLA